MKRSDFFIVLSFIIIYYYIFAKLNRTLNTFDKYINRFKEEFAKKNKTNVVQMSNSPHYCSLKK